MPAIKRLRVMLPMKRVQALMKKATNEAKARGKAAMEDEAMKEVLHQSLSRLENRPRKTSSRLTDAPSAK